MCFSAEVSLAVGAALLPAGGYCLFQASKRDKTYLALAVLPLVFGVQQISEGFVWSAINSGDANLVKMASLVFLAFALAFWPFWVPFSASLIEKRPEVKRAMRLLAITGLSFGLYLFIPIAMQADKWLLTRVYGHSIQYDFATFPIFPVVPAVVWHLSYVAIVSVPLLVSMRGLGLRMFGAMIAVSAALSQLAFWYAFVSVWCLFAGGLSVYLVFLFHRLPPEPAPSLPAQLRLTVALP